MEIFSNPLFATYSVYACNASIMGSQKLDCLTNKSICTSGCVCTAQTIHSQLLASVTLLPSLQFLLITSLHLPRSVTPLDFKSKSFTSSSTTSPSFPGPTSVSGSLNLQSNALLRPIIAILSWNTSVPSQSMYHFNYVFCSILFHGCQ